MDEARIEYVRLDAVKFWPRNPKEHNEDSIRASIERFGFTAPAIEDEKSGRLVAGHGRVEALLAMKDAGLEPPKRIKVDEDGEWMFPMVKGVAFVDPVEAEAYLLADNRLTETGGWQDALLADILRDLRDRNAIDDAIGFSERQIAELLREVDVTRATGMTPEEKLDGFLNAEIKQIVLFFESAEYDRIVSKLRSLMEANGLDSHTDAFLLLLKDYEDRHGEA